MYHITKRNEIKICRAKSPERCRCVQVFEHFEEAEKRLTEIKEEQEKQNSNQNDLETKKSDFIKELENTTDEAQKASIRMRIRIINRRLGLPLYDGYHTKEKEEEQERERLKKLQDFQKEDEISKENAKALRALEHIEVPEKLKMNDIVSYNKRSLSGKVYRGESRKQVETSGNGGMAMYGQGLYSTTDKSYAKVFGEVRAVGDNELPNRPLSLKTYNSFNYLEQLIREQYNIKAEHLYDGDFGVRELVQKMGYDGVSIGTGKGRILVKY